MMEMVPMAASGTQQLQVGFPVGGRTGSGGLLESLGEVELRTELELVCNLFDR